MGYRNPLHGLHGLDGDGDSEGFDPGQLRGPDDILPGRTPACTDPYQPPHPAQSHPQDCATCSEESSPPMFGHPSASDIEAALKVVDAPYRQGLDPRYADDDEPDGVGAVPTSPPPERPPLTYTTPRRLPAVPAELSVTGASRLLIASTEVYNRQIAAIMRAVRQ